MARPPLFPPGQLFGLDESSCAPPDVGGRTTYYRDPTAFRASGFSEDIPVERATTGWKLWPVVAFQVRPLDRVSVWLNVITKRGAGEKPPLIDLELRAGFGPYTRTYTAGVLTLPDWGSTGYIFQASGLLATQYELWAATRDGGVDRPAQPVITDWTFLFNHAGCCEIEIDVGDWYTPT